MDLAGHISAAALADMLRSSIQQGQLPTLAVTSNSMMPLLMRGDEVTLTALPSEAPLPGDVITFLSGQSLVTHRFWRTDLRDGRTYWLTRGDRPLQFDPPFLPEQAIGRVDARHRNGRTLFLSSGAGAKLNRHLAALAQWEQRCHPNRLLHRLLLAWAFVVSSIASLVAAIENRKS